MAKKTTFEHLDRVERNGDRATVIQAHGKTAITVLRDLGQRTSDRSGYAVWPQEGTKFLPPIPGRICPRCQGAHTIFYCPEGL